MMDLASVTEVALSSDHRRVSKTSRRKEAKSRLTESRTTTNTSPMFRPKTTPAITIVELCSKAEIGVGADIAFNSQELKGS